MVRTQIQLPERLYKELKALGDTQEWSLAETVRRAAELFVRSFPKDAMPEEQWELPLLSLGGLRVPDEDLRAVANARDDEL